MLGNAAEGCAQQRLSWFGKYDQASSSCLLGLQVQLVGFGLKAVDVANLNVYQGQAGKTE